MNFGRGKVDKFAKVFFYFFANVLNSICEGGKNFLKGGGKPFGLQKKGNTVKPPFFLPPLSGRLATVELFSQTHGRTLPFKPFPPHTHTQNAASLPVLSAQAARERARASRAPEEEDTGAAWRDRLATRSRRARAEQWRRRWRRRC